MFAKRIVIPVVIAALVVLILIPACASAAGGSISGKVAIPGNATKDAYINTTIDPDGTVHRNITQKMYATDLTVYAYNTKTAFVNVTFPNADGTYSIQVPEYGAYRVQVIPNELVDLVNPSNWTIVQYPDLYDRAYTVNVYGDVTGANIDYFAPGEYVPKTVGEVVTPTATPKATPAPGFAGLLVLAGLLGAFAIVRRNK